MVSTLSRPQKVHGANESFWIQRVALCDRDTPSPCSPSTKAKLESIRAEGLIAQVTINFDTKDQRDYGPLQ